MMESYHTFTLSGIMIGLYAISYILVKTKKLSLVNHRRIWNVILLISFLVSAIIGLILAIVIDEKKIVTWYADFLWLHVEFGVIMAIIAIFHAFWHIKYYLGMLKK